MAVGAHACAGGRCVENGDSWSLQRTGCLCNRQVGTYERMAQAGLKLDEVQ